MIILGILFVVLLLLGVPVAFTVGISAASFFYQSPRRSLSGCRLCQPRGGKE